MVAPSRSARSVAAAAKRPARPFLDGAPRARVDADERPAPVVRRQQAIRPREGFLGNPERRPRVARPFACRLGSPERRPGCLAGRESVPGQRPLDESPCVRPRVDRPVVAQRAGQEPASASRVVPDAPPGAARRQQRIAPDVGLEVDCEVEVVALPPDDAAGHFPQRRPRTFLRQPRCVDRLHPIHCRHEPGKVGVPTSDRQAYLGLGRPRPHRADGVQDHQEIADTLEAEEQDAARRVLRRRRAPPPLNGGKRRDDRIGAPDKPPFAAIHDLQVIEQRGGQGRARWAPRATRGGSVPRRPEGSNGRARFGMMRNGRGSTCPVGLRRPYSCGSGAASAGCRTPSAAASCYNAGEKSGLARHAVVGRLEALRHPFPGVVGAHPGAGGATDARP